MKRIIVLMLACLMLLSVVPFSVFAEEDVHENEVETEVETEETTEQVECPDKENTKKSHDTITAVSTKAPQCGERGYTLYNCECGKYFLGSYVEADANATHTWVEIDPAVAATCTATGTTAKMECSVCGTIKGGDEVKKTAHKYVLNPETGEEKCICGEIKPESECKSNVAVGKKHKWDLTKIVSSVDPTCSVAGSATYACQNEGCNVTKTIVIEATGKHTFSKVVAKKNATCTESGVLVAYQTCETCDNVFDAATTASQKPVAFEKAEEYFIPATGHAYTCTTTATKVVCANGCNTVIVVADEVAKHNENTEKVDAKCTEYGYEITTCLDCGKQLKNEILDPTGHTYDKEDPIEEAVHKAEDEGKICAPLYNVYDCVNCDVDVYVKVRDAQAHSYVENVEYRKATCSVVGQVASVCSVCGDVDLDTIVDTDINANNHVEIKVISKIADCTAGGKVYVACTACPYVNTITIAANTEHVKAYTITALPEGKTLDNGGTTDTTCDDERWGITGCEYCNVIIKNEGENEGKLPPVGHVGGTYVKTIPATCTTPAYEVYEGKCTNANCNVVKYQVAVGTKDNSVSFNTKAEANAVHGKDHLKYVAGNDCALGYEKYTCNAQGCAAAGAEIYVFNASTEHTYEDYVCTEIAKCVACGKPATEAPAANAHAMKVSVVNASDCTTDGSIKLVCKNDKCTYTVTIDTDNTDDTDITVVDGTPKTYTFGTDINTNATLLKAYFEKAIDAKVKVAYDAALAAKKAEANFDPATFVETTFKSEWYTANEATAKEAAFVEVIVENVLAKGHTPGEPEINTGVTCLGDGYTSAIKCVVCGLTTSNEKTIEATGHKFEATEIKTTLGCLQAAYTIERCSVCGTERVVDYTAGLQHINKDKEIITPSCDDTVADRKCVTCSLIVPTHSDIKVDDTNKESTCLNQGYIITYCAKCDVILDSVLTEGFGKHTYHSFGNNLTDAKIIAAVKAAAAAGTLDSSVDYTPVIYTDGKIEFSCKVCEEINEEMTIVIDAKEDLKDNYGKTLGLTLAVDNANKAGAGFSDSSLVAVTVNLNSVADLGVWGINFKFDYDWTKLAYVGFEFAEGSAFDGYTNAVQKFTYAPAVRYSSLVDVEIGANDKVSYIEIGADVYYEVERVIGAYITIGANTANDVNGNTVEAIINGENIALVTLYFEVTDYVAGTPGVEAIVTDKFAAFAFEDVMVLNKEAKEVNEAYKTVTTIAVEKFLDINADAHVNYADVLAMWKMISGEAEVEYNVVADVDKNGIVEAKDFMDLYSFVLGELDYEDMVAIVAEEEVAA